MTVRIEEPNLWCTETLLGQVLAPLIKDNSRVAFLCDAGDGEKVVARLRVMLTRKKAKRAARGKKTKQFRLHATIHKETHGGVRYDCIVMWKSVNEIHVMSEELEDILGG